MSEAIIIDGETYSRISPTWDNLQCGDILLLPLGNKMGIPIRLEPTCSNCASPEIWNQICVCDNPSCSRKIESINVRTCLSQQGVKVFRKSKKEGSE